MHYPKIPESPPYQDGLTQPGTRHLSSRVITAALKTQTMDSWDLRPRVATQKMVETLTDVSRSI